MLPEEWKVEWEGMGWLLSVRSGSLQSSILRAQSRYEARGDSALAFQTGNVSRVLSLALA